MCGLWTVNLPCSNESASRKKRLGNDEEAFHPLEAACIFDGEANAGEEKAAGELAVLLEIDAFLIPFSKLPPLALD